MKRTKFYVQRAKRRTSDEDDGNNEWEKKTCPILLVQWNSNLMTNFCRSFKKLWICHNPISMPSTTRFRLALRPFSNWCDETGCGAASKWMGWIEREENSIKLSANLQEKLKRIWNLLLFWHKTECHYIAQCSLN